MLVSINPKKEADSRYLLEDLDRRARAYQLLYALGETPETVATFEPCEAAEIVGMVRDVLKGRRSTWLHKLIAHRVPASTLRYVAGEDGAQ